MQQQQQQQLMTSNSKQLKQKGKEHQQQQRNKLLRLRPQTRNLKCDNNANNSNNNMIINNNANMMINAQVARGNNYSLPMHVSQEDKYYTDKKRIIFQKRMNHYTKQKVKV